MAQLTFQELIVRVLQGHGTACDYISAAVNRATGIFDDEESAYMDLKVRQDTYSDSSVAELARDILAFSNTHGGILIIGVNDFREILGHPELDSHQLREKLGPFIGTMVDYEVGICKINVAGREISLVFVLVPRCVRAYPNLLRKDIYASAGFGRKMKYIRGSLFYRRGNQNQVEPTGGDIEARASELQFTGASPRTRSSFLIQEDRPGVRLYAHINDRFVGRDSEVADLLSKFDDARGRGVSIAGLGGIGKTELAIEVVSQLHKSGKFRTIYSGSAKKILLGAFGPQLTDPCFADFPGFLRDLGAWLGLDFQSSTTLEEMKSRCLAELRSKNRILLFVDNLETVEDGRLFQFLDQEIPQNVWLLTTSRVHKIKNYIYSKSLEAMNPQDAAHLLRHELKRQGLFEYASMPIATLEQRAIQLQRHPLLIRWYAWSCRRQPDNWSKAVKVVPRAEVESFCVGHTLQNLSFAARRIFSAIATTQDQIEVTPQCLEGVSGSLTAELETSLYELECAGLISVAVDDRTGDTTYTTVALGTEPARELARQNDWESGFLRGFKEFLASSTGMPVTDPLIRYLIQFDPSSVKTLTADQIADLKSRIVRGLERTHPFRVPLLALVAECERHSNHIISADDYYKEAADLVLAYDGLLDRKASRILLEAATVARTRSLTETQLRRAISYLQRITDIEIAPLRILGMMVDMFARLGDKVAYDKYLAMARSTVASSSTRYSSEQINNLEEALSRAANTIATNQNANK